MSSPVSDYLSFGTTEYEEADIKSPLMNRQKMSPKKKEDEDPVLNLIDKVQMFQIAAKRINDASKKKGYKQPVFKLSDGSNKLRNFQTFFEAI